MMEQNVIRILFAQLLLATLVSAPALYFFDSHKALAQATSDAEAEHDAEEAQKRAQERQEEKAKEPPPALPGAESQEQAQGHANTDLNPTAALFDAINRGSLNAAKEALNRGADMAGKNVLNQTPLDMAIDLNRKDIVFLLLSLRTYNPDGRIANEPGDDLSQDSTDDAPKASHKGPTSKKIPQNLYDISGGTPIPAIGFLGFTPHRSP